MNPKNPIPNVPVEDAPVEIDTGDLHSKPEVDYGADSKNPLENPMREIPPGPDRDVPGPETEPG